jgi:hypothetical protein
MTRQSMTRQFIVPRPVDRTQHAMRPFLERIEVQSERRQGQLEPVQFPDAQIVRGTHDALNKLVTDLQPVISGRG